MSTELSSQGKQAIVTDSDNEPKDKVVICENCHSQVTGMYCSQCGQSVESTLKYFWTVMLHILDDIFSFDSRANRTLFPLVFRPGFLTKEYIAGRRVHYVPPLRLYLFISIVFFISLKYFINTDEKPEVESKAKAADIITQIEGNLVELEELVAKSPEQETELLLKKKARFEQYKLDITQQENENISALARQLASLEISNNFKEKPWKEEQFKVLKTQLEKLKADNTAPEELKLNIYNNPDGSFSLPFLSENENKQLDLTIEEIENKANNTFKEDPRKLIEAVISKMPQIMFVLLPLFAALLKLMYLFSNRLYLEHLTVALHSHSFIFFTILLSEIASFSSEYSVSNNITWLAELLHNFQICLLVWIPIYLFIMQKRVYQQGYLLTTFKYGVVGMIYTIMIAFAGVVALIWGAVSL